MLPLNSSLERNKSVGNFFQIQNLLIREIYGVLSTKQIHLSDTIKEITRNFFHQKNRECEFACLEILSTHHGQDQTGGIVIVIMTIQ